METWLLFALLSAVFAALTSIFAKVGIRDVDSNLATAVRTVVVLVMAWLMVLVAGSWDTVGGIDGETLTFLVLSGLATGASWLCYFRAIQLGDVNKVAPIDKSSTVLTMLLAFVFLGESFSALAGAGMVLMFVGTMMMIERKDVPANCRGRGSWLVYAVLSAVFAALTSILGKVGIEGVESNLGTAIRTVVVLVMAWAIVFMQGTQRQVRSIGRRDGAFLVLSGLATGASWLCFYKALQDGPASIVVPVDKLSILFTVVFAFLFLHEKMSLKSWAGLALLVAGTLMLLLRSEASAVDVLPVQIIAGVRPLALALDAERYAVQDLEAVRDPQDPPDPIARRPAPARASADVDPARADPAVLGRQEYVRGGHGGILDPELQSVGVHGDDYRRVGRRQRTGAHGLALGLPPYRVPVAQDDEMDRVPAPGRRCQERRVEDVVQVLVGDVLPREAPDRAPPACQIEEAVHHRPSSADPRRLGAPPAPGCS